MRDDDGRKLDHATLELLRLQAVLAVRAGQRPEEVAASMGMARGTVFMWLAKYRDDGLEALRARPVPGRPAKLDRARRERLLTLLVDADPRQLEPGAALWTRDLVRRLILAEFGTTLSLVSVGRVLGGLGLRPQRPVLRAWQTDPEAMAHWQATQFPAIRADAKRQGATVLFADETELPAGRETVVMLSVVSAKGAFRFAVTRRTVDAATFVDFCAKILHEATAAGGRPVYLVADASPAHRAAATLDAVAATDGRLKLFALPVRIP